MLAAGGMLEVEVLDAEGRPVPGAAVDLRYPDGKRVITGLLDFLQPQQTTGPDGKLRRPRLPPGRRVGAVSARGASPPRTASFEAAIVDRAERFVTVRLP